MFCVSWDGQRKSGFLTVMAAKTDIFVQFITSWEKQILARFIGIRKKNRGNHAFFSLEKKMSYIVLYLALFRIIAA